jgi:hypothetical protein
VAHDGKIPKVPCRRRGHNSNPFLLSKHASNSPRAQAENLRLVARALWSDITPIARRDWISFGFRNSGFVISLILFDARCREATRLLLRPLRVLQ